MLIDIIKKAFIGATDISNKRDGSNEDLKKRHRCVHVICTQDPGTTHLPTVVFPMTRGASGKLAFSSRRSFRDTGASQLVLSPWKVSLLLFGSSAILCTETKSAPLSSRALEHYWVSKWIAIHVY